MTLADLGSLGEFVGAVAVVLSLVYLAVQIRQNTRSTRASMIQAVYSQASSFSALLGGNLQAARVWRIGLTSPDELNEDETWQFISLATGMFRSFEAMFTQFQQTTHDRVAWEPWEASMLGFLGAPGFKVFWGLRRQSFGPAYRDYIDGLIADPSAGSSANLEWPPSGDIHQST
jgi:hypothetical protein